MLIFSLIVSVAFDAALVWYLNRFLLDGFGLKGTKAFTFSVPIAVVLSVLNIFATYFGWTAYFIIVAAIFVVAQLMTLEARSKLAFYILIASQVPAALVTIARNIQSGQWNWLDWVFGLLLLPLIEIASYKLASFISAEIDKSES